MRIVFMGTPGFAVPVLDALVAAGHEVAAAYTQPPRPGGRRGKAAVASPVQLRAEALGIAVRSPARLRGAEEQAAFAALGADVAVVAAYGLILPQPVLEAPRLGCLNVHGSLLPRWRGAAPIQRAILAGDAETGVGIMQMEAGLDTGPVRLAERTPIAGKTAGALAEELAAMGARLMVEVLGAIHAYPARPQPAEGVTYAAKVEKAEARLDFAHRSEMVERQVRAFNPPGGWFEVAGERVRVLAADAFPPSGRGRNGVRQAGGPEEQDLDLGHGDEPAGTVLDDRLTIACGEGVVRPTLVQRAGGRPMTAAELLRGFPIPVDTILG